MKILFVGGGTGGHFYPIIAVAQSVIKKSAERRILAPLLYYMAPSKYNPRALFDNTIDYINVPAGKIRRYFSLLNFTDGLKTLLGCFLAVFKMYALYPDVIFGKGGYASFPPLFAAKLLRIPVVIHESDSKPGKVNLWASKFAVKIAVSYPEAANYFKVDKKKIAFTGNPIRREVMAPSENGAREYFQLEPNMPVIVIIGGSQGAQMINDIIVEGLPELLNKYQIIHQTGKANLDEIKQTTGEILRQHPHKSRYHPIDFLNESALRMMSSVANIIVSRAGSGAIFEIAAWGVPSIIIPLPHSVSHDQTSNAFTYARTGAASVIEENNLSAHVVIAEINRINDNPKIAEAMRAQAKAFAKPFAADTIADALLDIALSHER